MSSEIRVATTQHKYLQRVILKRIIQVRLFNVSCFCMHILGIFSPLGFLYCFVCLLSPHAPNHRLSIFQVFNGGIKWLLLGHYYHTTSRLMEILLVTGDIYSLRTKINNFRIGTEKHT